MNREAWAMFLGLAVATAVGVLGFAVWKKHQELTVARTEVAESRDVAAQKNAHLSEVTHALTLERLRVEGLLKEFSSVSNTQHRLEAEMRAALESRDIAISELQGKLTVTIVDRILFDSGDATVKPEGTKVLDQVAQVLGKFASRQVQVFGHTDNVPIRVRFPSNWELSTARAVAAVRYLTEKAGVDPRRLSAVGCGEFQPIADNTTPEGRAKNRRIALVVLPEQFVPTDVAVSRTNTFTEAKTPGAASESSGQVVSTNLPPADAVPIPGVSTNAVSPDSTATEMKAPAARASDAESTPEPPPAADPGPTPDPGDGPNPPPNSDPSATNQAPSGG